MICNHNMQEKVTGGEVACPASGSCETILSSGYATVLGIPLSLIGDSYNALEQHPVHGLKHLMPEVFKALSHRCQFACLIDKANLLKMGECGEYDIITSSAPCLHPKAQTCCGTD